MARTSRTQGEQERQSYNPSLQSANSWKVIIAALITLAVIGAVFTVRIRRRSKREAQKHFADRSNPNKFDTTLGEFHDMREALRELQHTRAASRSVPVNRE